MNLNELKKRMKEFQDRVPELISLAVAAHRTGPDRQVGNLWDRQFNKVAQRQQLMEEFSLKNQFDVKGKGVV